MKRILLVLLVAAILLGLFTVGLHATLYKSPFGADFYTFWLASNTLFAKGQNPYSAEVTLQSQVGIYGRPALPSEDQVAFAYPPYALLPLLPTAWMSYDWAQAFWLSLNILLLAALLMSIYPGGHKGMKFLYLLFYPVAFGLILGNFAVPLGTILIFIFALVVDRETPSVPVQIAAGAALAWATAKPQFIWLYCIFMALLVLRKRLKPLGYSFVISLTVYLGISWLLMPDWLQQWLGRITEYAGYVHSQPTLTEFLNQFLPNPVSIGVSGIIGALCGIASFMIIRRWWQGKTPVLQVLAWIGFVTYLFHPHGIAYEQICFLAPLAWWAMQQRKGSGWPVWVFWVGACLFSWVLFVVGKWYYHPADRWPVYFNGLWVVWLFWKQRKTLIAQEA